MSPDELIGSLRQAYFRLLGEVHDNPDHHAIQVDLLTAMGAGALKPVVALEQFDLEHDAALQQRQQQGKIDAEAVADAVNFNRKGWTWDYYRPLIETALRFGMPLRAANLSRADAGQIVKLGLAALTPERIAALHLDAAWSGAKEQVLRDIIIEGHCRALPESMVPAMTAAQRARDATLARSLLHAGSDGAVLIAGNGHVRRDLAVPLYLQAAVSGVTVCAVGILEVEAGAGDRGTTSKPPRREYCHSTLYGSLRGGSGRTRALHSGLRRRSSNTHDKVPPICKDSIQIFYCNANHSHLYLSLRQTPTPGFDVARDFKTSY